MKKVLTCLFLCSGLLTAQNTQNGQFSGNFQSNSQIYFEDAELGITEENLPSEEFLTNSFLNLSYNSSNFSAGIRYEANQNVLLGMDSRYNGEDFTYKYVRYNKYGLDITAGNFYEQFGSGMILRAYEERNLGYDNAFDGIRLKYNPIKGVYLKSLVGRQRLYFDKSEGIVRGVDAEVSLNEAISGYSKKKTQILFGASFVSKYQKDLDPLYILPENVVSWATRLSINYGKWNLGGEYVYKNNDPSATNNFIYKEGQALLLNASYSQRGFGVSLAAKRIDNMSSNSDRNLKGSEVSVNYLPALTKQHAYTLATIYPYGTISNGEMGLQAELNYKIPKGSKLGGKYGTGVVINFSNVYDIHRAAINDSTAINETGTLGYSSDFFKVGDELFFQEFSTELSRKINRKLKFVGTYIHTLYNSSVVVGYNEKGIINANIAILETQYKIKPRHSIRTEIQHLWTKKHEGNWAMFLAEYTVSPKYFIAVQDLYNYGNGKVHYPNISAGYIKGTTRFALGYGKQRQGIFCVGGVCREVPKSNGISLSITSSF
jgi:hypothetical protein